MKAAEVYKILKNSFDSWAKDHDFSRLKGGRGWTRPVGDSWITVSVGIHRHGAWDSYAGGAFVLDFEIGTIENRGLKNRGFRYWLLLTDEKLEEVRQIQNDVIASLTPPPPDHPFLLDERIRDYYLKQFQPMQPPGYRTDIWLRYFTPDHVERWASFLVKEMPNCLEEFERRTRPSEPIASKR